jgi:hypothetical protein
MITRKQYLENSSKLHNEYYSQFVNSDVLCIIKNAFGVDILRKAYTEDENFNTIPLSRWDALTMCLSSNTTRMLENCGDYFTLAGGVCILKQAARIWIDAVVE